MCFSAKFGTPTPRQIKLFVVTPTLKKTVTLMQKGSSPRASEMPHPVLFVELLFVSNYLIAVFIEV